MGAFKVFLSLRKNPGPGPGESGIVKEYPFTHQYPGLTHLNTDGSASAGLPSMVLACLGGTGSWPIWMSVLA